MSLMKWNPFKSIGKLLKKNYPKFDLPEKAWEVQIDVYGEKEKTMVEMNFPELDPLKTNLCLKDKCLLIADNEDSIEAAADKPKQNQHERIISFPREVKKIVLTAVLNIA